MVKPTKADIGRTVIYTGNTYPGGKPEEGVITSFNDYVVFVRYGADEWRAHMKKDREAFEAWLKRSGAFTDWSRNKTDEANPYHKPLVERTWQAWQAACAYARS